jgi:hypothetical protein
VTVYYTQIRVLLDPEQSDALPDGGRCQDVSVILTDAGHGDQRLRPAAITLDIAEVRDLAFELLELAEHTEATRSTQ